jgi:hypothetical protein
MGNTASTTDVADSILSAEVSSGSSLSSLILSPAELSSHIFTDVAKATQSPTDEVIQPADFTALGWY